EAFDAAVLHIALDQFREVNRRIGRRTADLVLVEVARRLRQGAGPSATVVRLGGDEFGVLLRDAGSEAEASDRAQAILHSLSRPVRLAGAALAAGAPRRTVAVGASIGVAMLVEADPSEDWLDEVLRRADIAAQRAKHLGRGRVERFSPGLDPGPPAHRALQARRAMECRLRTAIEHGSLEIHLQPQVELPSGRVAGYEALARWEDPLIGRVPPDQFIPLAEQTGLILDLGAWVLRTACRQAADLPVRSSVGPIVAVNVSPIQLAEPGFVDLVVDALAEAGLPAHRLCLELTETAAIDDLATTSEQLGLLRDLGVEIALDDFGTGYSSLTLLRSLPLTVVKIDRSFVANVARSTQDAVLVRMVIEAAHSFGLQTCAEGVEDADQAGQLVAMGCDAAQGWFFGRPEPLDHHLAPIGTGGEAPPGFDPQLAPPIPLGAADAMVMVTAPDSTIVYASSTSTLLLGWTPQQMVGTSAVDYVHPDSLTDGASLPALGGGVVTYRVLHRDGTERFIEIDSRGLHDDEGTLLEVINVCHDVTEATRARVALDASEERFRHVFDSAPIGMALSGLDGRIWHVNDEYAAMLGHAPEELVGCHVDTLTHPDDRDRDVVNLTELGAGIATRHEVSKRYLHADGHAVPVVVHASLVLGTESRPGYVMAHIVRAGRPG
uniref:EAL domain-containing protein n=1 Tax=Actinotalea sp. TaxID=1872145 RepID=UPI0035638D0E